MNMTETELIQKLQENIHSKQDSNTNVKKEEGVVKTANPFYEMVNHPKHYNNYDVEVIDMMEKIWGTKATIEWCKMTAFKYRMRMGTKPSLNNTKEDLNKKLIEDFNKEQWYLKKADELKSKLNN